MEFSAGCVVFKKCKIQNAEFKIRYLLGKHSGYHKWVLPKGLIEDGEKGQQTALRETKEEMGVEAKLVDEKLIHKVKYFFYADLKKNVKQETEDGKQRNEDRRTRRVEKYQEEGGTKVKVFKTVYFYLAKYLSGNPEKNHGWEMEKAGWFCFEKALDLMAFDGEKEALKKARKKIEDF